MSGYNPTYKQVQGTNIKISTTDTATPGDLWNGAGCESVHGEFANTLESVPSQISREMAVLIKTGQAKWSCTANLKAGATAGTLISDVHVGGVKYVDISPAGATWVKGYSVIDRFDYQYNEHGSAVKITMAGTFQDSPDTAPWVS